MQENAKGEKQDLYKIQTTQAKKNLKDAAQKRQDEDMLRIIANEDLIAYEVLYHYTCMSSYKNERNVEALHARCDEDPCSIALQKLNVEIHDDPIRNKNAFTISSLLGRFRQLLTESLTQMPIEARIYKTDSWHTMAMKLCYNLRADMQKATTCTASQCHSLMLLKLQAK